MSKETGGPAFPTEAYDRKRQTMVREEGMSLRDYFAATVLPTILTYGNTGSYATAAEAAYLAADAMLKAREEG